MTHVVAPKAAAKPATKVMNAELSTTPLVFRASCF